MFGSNSHLENRPSQPNNVMNAFTWNEVSLLLLGFAAQGLFGLRILIQWYTAEKTKSVEPPSSFWYVSLIAALLYLLYGLLRVDWVNIVGQCITYFIYIRNLQHLNHWSSLYRVSRIALLVTPISLLLWAISKTGASPQIAQVWSTMTVLGFIGQGLLNARFVYQWIQLENSRSATLSKWFWIISIVGSLLLLAYGFNHPTRKFDPVLILAQTLGLAVYVRNLFIIKKLQPAV